MLFVGTFTNDRSKDDEFWAVLWQGPPPPSDFRLVAAYNMLTDERLIVFEATTTATIRWLDRLNLVGRFESRPVLDQTQGYESLFARDFEAFRTFLGARGQSDGAIDRAVAFRRAMHEAASVPSAIEAARAWRERRAGGVQQ